MVSSNFDVVVVGAGAAGLTAAIGLARAGFTVAVVEGGEYPGAENWSGCVYFCENLAHPAILGPKGIEALAWERRLVERGFFLSDGAGMFGMTYRDPKAFSHCYTVLRPIFDHHLAQVALRLGVALLTATTAESLIRDKNRVIGVCTQRGPLYADLVYLAEGDASQLVTREGYERHTDQREAPKFLQGIKQIIELPAGAIEEMFGVGAEEGVAYEMVLRNGTLRGRPVHLNMGGFLYTNRTSLSIGLVLPASHLNEHFGGDPNLLMEWFEQLPVLRPWLRQGQRGAFGAKLIRGGGIKDVPRLIDDGLAIGGAASGIGVDFPYPNFTGPATYMGLLFAQAATRIREEKSTFTREALERHYLLPLQQSHYWQDVEYLRNWPGYVKKTRVFFDRQVDLVLGTAYIWTRPDHWFFGKWFRWLRMIGHLAGPRHWASWRAELRMFTRALDMSRITGQPSYGQLILDGVVNGLRDLFHSPRPHLPPAGEVRLHYVTMDETPKSQRASVPTLVRRWFRRVNPVLAVAARRIYHNNKEPLVVKLHGISRLFLRQLNIFDVIGVGGLALIAAGCGAVMAGWDWLRTQFRRPHFEEGKGIYPLYVQIVQRALDMSSHVTPARQAWEDKLGKLDYQSVRQSHVHVFWPWSLAHRQEVLRDHLWHVCPAHVYDARPGPQGQLQVVVNYENCIKCESCWRVSDIVDWARDGRHRFRYVAHSPALQRLLAATQLAGTHPPTLPRTIQSWDAFFDVLSEQLRGDLPGPLHQEAASEVSELTRLLDQVEQKLIEFDAALDEEPRTVDRDRREYLEILARYAQQLASHLVEILKSSVLEDSVYPSVVAVYQHLLDLATHLANRAEQRTRRVSIQRLAWAAADGRLLRFHYVAGLRGLLNVLSPHLPELPSPPVGKRLWLNLEDAPRDAVELLDNWSQRLDEVFATSCWRDLDKNQPLSATQDAVLRDVLSQVPALVVHDLARTLHPVLRKGLLADLGRRDPSLAYRVARHLWARDLAKLATPSMILAESSQRWTRGDEWAGFVAINGKENADGSWDSEQTYLPIQGISSLLLLVGSHLIVIDLSSQAPAGLRMEPVTTLGLKGGGWVRLCLDGMRLPASAAVDRDRILRAWAVLSSADLIAIALGMTDQLCRRAIDHASTRVQFPGLFQDEQARDTIGKFGAVKQMLAEMAAGHRLLETICYCLSPLDFSAASVQRLSLLKALVAELLAGAPGSITYHAGQIFGGTGYSEDDILAKFYRDASAWRFLGPLNTDVYRHHGDELLRGKKSNEARFTVLPGEDEQFDQVAQRKALQIEWDEVRVQRSRLRSLVNKLDKWHATQLTNGADAVGPLLNSRFVTLLEGLGRQDAFLVASKAMLLRVHARFENGFATETDHALLRVWLRLATAALDQFDMLVQECLRGTNASELPLAEPGLGACLRNYTDYLAAQAPYDSGDYLFIPVDLRRPRLIPELIVTDTTLASRSQSLRDLFVEQFGHEREGVCFERYIENKHRPDAADLDFCRRHGLMRWIIPQELGGEGRPKIEYYLLTGIAQNTADVAMSLTIQVNTSIGTTPVLLARDKDLPKAQKEVGPFVGDTNLHNTIQTHLEKLVGIATSESLSMSPITTQVEDLHKQLDESFFSRAALRGLGHRFITTWQAVRAACRHFDEANIRQLLIAASLEWRDLCGKAEEYHEELARRRGAYDLFLRWVASGHISAFALTEPSAGSDTARIVTRARLHSVPVEPVEQGRYRFLPVGGKQHRYLIDARQLEFRSEAEEPGVIPRRTYRAYYRWSDHADPAPICLDEYDYETDAPDKLRYFLIQYESTANDDSKAGHSHAKSVPVKVYFHDIAQLRFRDGQLWYDYWELNGAKMWITNGRMAGIMCLYAKTAEGVTGFIVDRHAEGLVVGKDEEKLGQCGSPTNELSLQAVRVPRENVIGLEGRGQVNALETLNVGRAGLAMTAMAQLEGLIESSRHYALETHGEIPDWVDWRLRHMAELRFIAEALAFEVVGRFEHPQCRSIRLESAIAKMLVSEILLQVIDLAEEIHGPAGQTQLHLVEKRKRDARVITIYEGTNEIQRFLILRELATDLAGRWSKSRPLFAPRHVSREAQELEELKAALRQRVDDALAHFGAEVWQNPNLQATCFWLAESAAWLKAADSTLGRLSWLQQYSIWQSEQPPEEGDAVTAIAPNLILAAASFRHCAAETRLRFQWFDREIAYLSRGHYTPVIRAATLLLSRGLPTQLAEERGTAHQVTRPLSLLVVVEPQPVSTPQPHIVAGQWREAYWRLRDADRSALEIALRLRDQAHQPVSIQVVAVGPRAAARPLRELLSLRVDRVRMVVSKQDIHTPDQSTAVLSALLKSEPTFDLILGGVDSSSNEEGVTLHLLAESLGVPYLGQTSDMTVRVEQDTSEVWLHGLNHRRLGHRLPAALGIETEAPLRSFTTTDYLTALSRTVERHRWPKQLAARALTLLPAAATIPVGDADSTCRVLTPAEAAHQIWSYLGHATPVVETSNIYTGTIEKLGGPVLPRPCVVAFLATDGQGRLSATAPACLRSAHCLAELVHLPVTTLVLTLPQDSVQRRAVAQVRSLSSCSVVLVTPGDVAADNFHEDLKSRLLTECWRIGSLDVRHAVGEPWTEAVFAAQASRSILSQGAVILRVRHLERHEDHLRLETTRARGAVRVQQTLTKPLPVPCWLSLTADADAGTPSSSRPALSNLVYHWQPPLERFLGRIDVQHLLQDARETRNVPRLADAEFIIDVGFGVGNRDGYEQVVEPLERALRQLGVRDLLIGGSRKVTEELHLLPADRQIGQSGVSVQPRILIALGISGAPQHLNYIGPRTTIFAFNRDPEAPIMTWNQRQPQPRVYPVVGDLFETVPLLIAALNEHQHHVEEVGVAEPVS
ncbi:MAG: FAD-dependent oxidoreductase [Gemmataceae bacterium]